MNAAEALVMLAQIWGGLGALVALVFLTVGMDRIDEDAQGAYVFRPLLIPGVVLLWPLVLWRWRILEGGGDRDPGVRYRPRRHAHRWYAYAMPVAIVAVIAAGLSVRQTWPGDIAPEQIAAPAPAQEATQ